MAELRVVIADDGLVPFLAQDGPLSGENRKLVRTGATLVDEIRRLHQLLGKGPFRQSSW